MRHACPEGAPGGGEDQLRFWVAPIQGLVPVPTPAAQGQADSGTAGKAIAHGVGRVTGARPLAVPCAFACGIGAAASITLGARVQEDTGPDAVPAVTLTAAAGDLLGACGDTVGVHMAAPVVDKTAVGFLAQLPISCVAILAGARPLPGGHLGAVGVGGAAPVVMCAGVHL